MMARKITIKCAPAAMLGASNPVLLSGQLCYEPTLPALKIGDGVTPWASLPDLLATTKAEYDGLGYTYPGGFAYIVPMPPLGYTRWSFRRIDYAGYAHGNKIDFNHMSGTVKNLANKPYAKLWTAVTVAGITTATPGDYENFSLHYYNIDVLTASSPG